MKNLRILRLVTLASVSVTAMSAAAFAQSTGVETVVVTGSRVITDAANSPTPVTAISQDELLTTTPTTIADALEKLPQFVASSTARNAGGASNNGGGDYLNLRNFGQQRTLVLEDGMRVPSSNANGSVDVSTLPQLLVSHVDAVTSGASAVYGSDAITGVVNFILDKNFTGFKYDADAGISSYADGTQWKLGFAAGTSLFGGRGHIEGELSAQHQDQILKDARPIGSVAEGQYGAGTPTNPLTNIQNARGNQSSPYGTIVCSNCSVNGQEFLTTDMIGPTNPGQTTPSASINIGGDGGYWATQVLNAALSRQNGFARFSYDLDDDTVFFAQFTGAQARIYSIFIPVMIDVQRQTLNYFKDNAFLPASQQALLGNDCATDPNCHTDGTNVFQSNKWFGTNFGINPETPGQQIGNPTRRTNSVQRNLTFSTGVSGSVFGDFNWNVHYTHGEERDSVTGINNGNNQYADASHDAVLQNGQVVCYNDTAAAIALYGNIYPGCVPMNSFGATATTEQQFAYWSRNTQYAMTLKMDDIEGELSGDIFNLPAGPIRAAVSGEMRWLGYIVNSNASPTAVVNCYGLRLCGALGIDPVNHPVAQLPGTGPVNQNYVTQFLWDNNTLASVAKYENVWEFSGELGIPILKDVPFIQNLNADIAGRYTNYSPSGAVQTWKAGLDWRVNDDVRLRGSTSVDIRAPTLNDLYSPATVTSSAFGPDLLTGASGGVEQLSTGNANLVPEVSRTYTGGVVYTPSYIPGLSASVDYYQITLKNAISNISGSNVSIQSLCNLSAGASPYCALYVRPFGFANTTPANFPTELISEQLNSAFSVAEGEDYEVDYHFDTADVYSDMAGLVNLRAFVNVQPVIDSQGFPGAPISHTTAPKSHATLLASYSLNDWSFATQWSWFSDSIKTSLYGAGQTYYQEPRVPTFNTWDFTLSKKLTFGNDSAATAYVNVVNAFNATPPVVNGQQGNPGAGTNVNTGEDVIGRYFTIGIRGAL